MDKQYAFYLETDRCLQCRACEIACKQWNGLKAGTVRLRRLVEVVSGTFPEIKKTFFSLTCAQCARAPCAAACPAGAITRREVDGILVVERGKCLGCHSCFQACPFGIPQFDEKGLMHKCEMCLERLEKGFQPVCAATCPTRALHFGDLRKLADLAAEKNARKLARASGRTATG